MRKIRNVPGNRVQDESTIVNTQYNEVSGAQKQIDVGPKLLPLLTVVAGAEVKTTNATTAIGLPSMGRNLAIYNNSAVAATVTFGDASVISQAIGTVNATSGAVGIPCTPNAWSYHSAGDATFVITSSVNLIVFLIDDETSILIQK